MIKYYLLKVKCRDYEHSSVKANLEAMKSVKETYNATFWIRLWQVGIIIFVINYALRAFNLY